MTNADRWEPLRADLRDELCAELRAPGSAESPRFDDLRRRAEEAARLWDDAAGLWWDFNEAEARRPVALFLEPDWQAPDWLPEILDRGRRIFFELRTSSRLCVRRPSELDLRQVTEGRGIPARLIFGAAAMVAALNAAKELDRMARTIAAGARVRDEDTEYAADYLGAAREALAIAEGIEAESRARADFTRPAAQAKRDARAARIADFAQRWRASVAADPSMKQEARLEELRAAMGAGFSTVEGYLAEARALGLVD